jgi:hypothetical protein
MGACYGGTDVMERSCAVARGIDINIGYSCCRTNTNENLYIAGFGFVLAPSRITSTGEARGSSGR